MKMKDLKSALTILGLVFVVASAVFLIVFYMVKHFDKLAEAYHRIEAMIRRAIDGRKVTLADATAATGTDGFDD